MATIAANNRKLFQMLTRKIRYLAEQWNFAADQRIQTAGVRRRCSLRGPVERAKRCCARKTCVGSPSQPAFHPEGEPPMPSAVRNVAREKLEQGQLSLGVGVRITRSVEIAKAMAVAGFDWLFLDMEHGVMSLEACAQISTAALDAGIAPIARVPNGEYAIATRALDNGALGIVMPHVDSAAEAREVVNRLKYPPIGHRSMGGIGPHYGLRSASSSEAASALNAANLTIVMLETPTAIANAEEIASVPGVDVLLIGTNDLCAEMGIHGDFGNERVAEAYRTMIAAARKHGKFPGMAGVYNETLMPRYIEMGARFVLSGQDAAFMAAGAAQRTGFLRKLPVGAG